MNNNLPEDINTLPNQNKVDDNTIETNENSNLHLASTSTPSYTEETDTTQDTYDIRNPADVALALSSLENIIRQKLDVIEKSQLEANELRTQLSDIAANSEEYYKADKALKEAQKQKKQIKATIMGTPEAKTLQGKYDEAKQSLKEDQDSLSQMLLEYYETMRVKEIDDITGEPRDLIVNVKIAPKKMK